MATANFKRQACTETYEDVEKLIYRLCWNAVEKFNGEFDDYLSVANEAYMKAYETYEGRHGVKFSTWMHKIVRNDILTEVATRRNHEICNTDRLEKMQNRERFDVCLFITSLPADAAEVVRLTLETPRELLMELVGKDASDFRDSLRKSLERIGWSIDRIAGSFAEIGRALVS